MSINIDLGDNPESSNRGPDRVSSVLSVLLAIVIFVAVIVVVLVARQRTQNAAVLAPSPTVAITKAAATAVRSMTPAIASTATQAARTTGTAQATVAPVTTVASGGASPTTRTTIVVIPTTSSAATAAPTKAPSTAVTQAASPTAPAAPTAAVSWYFAEGASVSPFKTSYLIFNPGTQPAKVTVNLYPENGKAVQKAVTVGAGTQARVSANDMLPNAAFGAGISSDQPVYVERQGVGDRDGTTAAGMKPAKTWYFPEGQTGDDFTTWLLVLNPNATPADLTVTYYPVGAKAVVKTYSAPPTARLTIAAQKDVASAVMAITIESSQPVVAEEGIYFDGQKAAYGGPGMTTPSKTWYVAAGNTQVGFTDRIAMFNPGKEEAVVKATLIGSKQAAKTAVYSIDAQSKDDLVLNDGADEQLVAVILESDKPILAQNVTLYMSGGESGPVAAYAAPALSAAAKQWYVPNVTTGSEYDSYLTLFNPGTAAASVTVTYVVQGGEAVAKTYAVAAKTSTTLRVSDEVKGKVVDAAAVSSSQPVLVERVTMLRTTVGATASEGVAAP